MKQGYKNKSITNSFKKLLEQFPPAAFLSLAADTKVTGSAVTLHCACSCNEPLSNGALDTSSLLKNRDLRCLCTNMIFCIGESI